MTEILLHESNAPTTGGELSKNPAAVYLATLGESSRRIQFTALATVAAMLPGEQAKAERYALGGDQEGSFWPELSANERRSPPGPQQELKDKFRENFEVMRGEVLRANYGTNPW